MNKKLIITSLILATILALSAIDTAQAAPFNFIDSTTVDYNPQNQLLQIIYDYTPNTKCYFDLPYFSEGKLNPRYLSGNGDFGSSAYNLGCTGTVLVDVTMISLEDEFGFNITVRTDSVNLNRANWLGDISFNKSHHDLDFASITKECKRTRSSEIYITIKDDTAYSFKRPDCLPVELPGDIPNTPVAPDRPYNLSLIEQDSKVTISWAEPNPGSSPIKNYNILVSPRDLPSWTISVPASPITITGLTNDLLYRFSVSAVNEQRESEQTRISGIPYLDITPSIKRINPPTNLIATEGNGFITLQWTAPIENGVPLLGYEVFYIGTNTPPLVDWNVIPTTELSLTVTGLENDKQYLFHVRAISSEMNSIFSDMIAATPGQDTKSKRSCGDCTPPTFYKNKDGIIIVKNGFDFNGVAVDVTNYHTEYPLITVNTDQTYTMKLKVYETNYLKWFQVAFGVPETGDPLSEAESLVTFYLNYDGTIEKITKVEKYPLVTIIDANVNKVDCGYADSECYELSLHYKYRDTPQHNIIAIQAVDMALNPQTHYLNDGIEVVGKSMNVPLEDLVTASHGGPFYPQKTGIVELTLISYKQNLWEDKYGYLWEQDFTNHTFDLVSIIPPFPRIQDAPTEIMTRMHSDFADRIISEEQRALEQFDSSEINNYNGEKK